MWLRNQDPDFDPPSKLTRTALQTTMKEEQEKLLEKFRLRRKEQDNGVGFKHVHNGDLCKLKNLYTCSQKNKVRKANYGGYVTLPYKKHCDNKRSCVQDAFANLSKLFGFEMKDLIYKYFEPEDYIDSDINKVLRHLLITNRFFSKKFLHMEVKVDQNIGFIQISCLLAASI